MMEMNNFLKRFIELFIIIRFTLQEKLPTLCDKRFGWRTPESLTKRTPPYYSEFFHVRQGRNSPLAHVRTRRTPFVAPCNTI